eukprot:1829252-Pyramimonas_sp.AAC.1
MASAACTCCARNHRTKPLMSQPMSSSSSKNLLIQSRSSTIRAFQASSSPQSSSMRRWRKG